MSPQKTKTVSKEEEEEEEELKGPDEWLDEIIEEVRPIKDKLEKNCFSSYRQIGLVILRAGYKKGEWQWRHIKRFCEELDVSRATFSLYVRLGELSESKFRDVVNTYSSVNQWYRQGLPKKGVSVERENLLRSLIRSFPTQARVIREILRVEKAYLREKDLEDFGNKVFYGKETPFDVFVKYYYLPKGSDFRVPNWILIGFQALLSLEHKDQPADATVIAQLREILEKKEVRKEEIESKAKENLYTEWGLA